MTEAKMQNACLAREIRCPFFSLAGTFSGYAGWAQSNIRKWMLDSDLVEAVIKLPTDEFFNADIYT